jgi:hypothetical protein
MKENLMDTRSLGRLGSAFLLMMSLAAGASAQATRTWVSGVGADANPCSRTAPCKTWAGAISKTAPGGEIDALDPGGFGTLTINKSITVDGAATLASTLASGTIGFTINAATTDQVTIRNMSIDGAGTPKGTIGIRILTAGDVDIQNVYIFNFSQRAVSIENSAASQIQIRGCYFHDNGQTAVVVQPAVSSNVQVAIDKSTISKNGVGAGTGGGIFVSNGGRVVVRDSQITQNTAPGVEASTGGEALVDFCDVSFNSDGVKTSGGTLRISRSTLAYNSGQAANNVSGTLNTFSDNRMAGNGTNNTGTGAVPGVQ